MAFYGVDDFESGQIMGEQAIKLLNGKGKVAIITSMGATNLQRRLEGAREALKAAPGIEIVEAYDIKEDAVRCAEIIATGSRRYPDLGAWLSVGGWPVFTRNALAGVDPSKTKVISFDTVESAIDLLREGKVQVLLGQKYFGWGSEPVKILHGIKNGRHAGQRRSSTPASTSSPKRTSTPTSPSSSGFNRGVRRVDQESEVRRLGMSLRTLASGLAVVALLQAPEVARPWFTDVFPPEEFAARRQRVLAEIGDGVAVLQGATERPAESPFRQNSQVFYLTGLEVPRAIVVLDGRTKRTTRLPAGQQPTLAAVWPVARRE